MEEGFNPRDVLEKIRKERKIRRKQKTCDTSKLFKFQAELFGLCRAGASLRDMQFWLRNEKGVKIDHSNIKRFLDARMTASECA